MLEMKGNIAEFKTNRTQFISVFLNTKFAIEGRGLSSEIPCLLSGKILTELKIIAEYR